MKAREALRDSRLNTHIDAPFMLPVKDLQGVEEYVGSIYAGDYLPHNTQIYTNYLAEQVLPALNHISW